MSNSKLELKHKVLASTLTNIEYKNVENGTKTIYDATRASWTIDPMHANQVDFIFAVYENEVKAIFVPCDGLKSKYLKWNWNCVNPLILPDEKLRYEFAAVECNNKSIIDLYLEKSFPKDTSWRNPVRYFYDGALKTKRKRSMKNLIRGVIVAITLIFATNNLIAQELKATKCNPFLYSCRSGKWGYVDNKGKCYSF